MTGASLDGVDEVVMRVCEVGVKWEATARGRQSASGHILSLKIFPDSGHPRRFPGIRIIEIVYGPS